MSTNYKILIVDDNANLRETLHNIIEGKGYTSITADSGKTALRKAREEKPIVALIDLKLQDMPGLAVMKEIKRQSPDTECIVLTGYATKESAIEAVNLGAYGYVQKPCDIEQLLLTIHRAFEKHNTEEEKQKLQRQLAQAQKMESIGRLASGIAHDFNNILFVVNGFAELTLQKMDKNDPSNKYVETILEAGTKAKNLTQQLLAFSRNQLNKPQILNLNTTIINMQNMILRLIGEEISINIIMGKQLWNIKADRSQIEQVIMNLALNARDAMPGGGDLTIKMENIVIGNREAKELPDIKKGKYVLMTISDTGHGMSEEVRECIFEPFFTTKKEGEGTGLGLATVYGIIKQNNGFIYVYSELNKETVFKIYLPYSEEETQNNVVKTLQHSACGTETVLVAEDDKGVREIVVKMLSILGYTVLEAIDGPSALGIYKTYNSKIDLLLTDVVMPEMNGHELSQQIKKLNPAIKIIFMSGYTEDTIYNHGILKSDINFLQKPIISLSLAQAIRRVLDS